MGSGERWVSKRHVDNPGLMPSFPPQIDSHRQLMLGIRGEENIVSLIHGFIHRATLGNDVH